MWMQEYPNEEPVFVPVDKNSAPLTGGLNTTHYCVEMYICQTVAGQKYAVRRSPRKHHFNVNQGHRKQAEMWAKNTCQS